MLALITNISNDPFEKCTFFKAKTLEFGGSKILASKRETNLQGDTIRVSLNKYHLMSRARSQEKSYYS